MPESETIPRVFTLDQLKKWDFYIMPANLSDKDRSIQMTVRVRPQNDNELATEERKLRSYRISKEGRDISFGQGETTQNFKFDTILDEETTQEDVKNVCMKDRNKINTLRTSCIVYGQTGSGKTQTICGGVWTQEGLIRQYFNALAKERADEIRERKCTVNIMMV